MTATEPYDVIVLGGGTAGVVAAIQAGRAGGYFAAAAGSRLRETAGR